MGLVPFRLVTRILDTCVKVNRMENQKQAWRFILEGKLAERSRSAIEDILVELQKPEHRPKTISLASGQAGRAIVYHYLGQARQDPALVAQAEEWLDTAAVGLQEGVHGPSLYSGFTGLAWAFQHIRGFQEDDPLKDLDESLIEFLEHSPWTGDYDLIIGLVGYGVYGLERLPYDSGRALLERVLDRLDEIKVQKPQGLTWHTSPQLLPTWQREINPDGYYNLGLAHGVPAVIALLGLIHQAGIQRDRTLALLEGAVNWLLAQRQPEGSGSSFGTLVPTGRTVVEEHSPSRIAWCYGDLGLSVALLLAARSVGRDDWEARALEIARYAANRPMEHASDRDGGICHGAAGNAHLFNRLYQATNEALFKEAALRWFDRLFLHCVAGRGIAGFAAFHPSMPGDFREDPWVTETELLEGVAGIALCLQAGLGGPVPDWDTFLLTHLPPRHI